MFKRSIALLTLLFLATPSTSTCASYSTGNTVATAAFVAALLLNTYADIKISQKSAEMAHEFLKQWVPEGDQVGMLKREVLYDRYFGRVVGTGAALSILKSIPLLIGAHYLDGKQGVEYTFPVITATALMPMLYQLFRFKWNRIKEKGWSVLFIGDSSSEK